MTINGESKIITNNNLNLAIDLSFYKVLAKEYNITLKLLSWSKGNASAKITKVSSEYNLVLDSTLIQSVSCSEHATNSQLTLDTGIVEQYADLRVYDRYHSLNLANNDELLNSVSQVKIDILDDEGTLLITNTYIATDWDFKDGNIIDIRCADPSERFGQIETNSITVGDRTAHDYLVLAFSYVDNYSWRYIDNSVKSYCEQIKMPKSWARRHKLSELLQYICTLACLRIYWSNNEFVVMRCF